MLSDLQLVYMGPRNSTQLLKINTTKFQVEREPVYKCGIQGRIGGSGDSNPPSPEMFRFLVESEGKEVESKRKKMKGIFKKLSSFKD